MTATELSLERFADIEGRRAAALYKHTISVMASISYGLLASSVWKPVFEQAEFGAVNDIGIGLASILLFGSFLLAPLSEPA